jgi:hypothetical protein
MGMDSRIAEIMQSAPASLSKPGGGGDLVAIACYGPTTATIRQGIDGRQHFVLSGPLRDSHEVEIGRFEAVYQAKIFAKSDLFSYPDQPAEPFDRPYAAGEAEWTPLLNPAKAKWSFDNVGHVVTGVGLGLSRIAVEPYVGITFWFSTNWFLFGHTGGAEGLVGEGASLATASFPGTPALVDGVSFPVDASHLLSLSRGSAG